ncbi:hypothetical protein C7475_10295 [Chitinophaga sp. S165]|nr:hypothetical protein C7475_10295 [Chitinophaga sp. S165]
MLICGCKKDDQKPGLVKGLRGRVIVSSCVTTAVEVLNTNLGSRWTDCRDKRIYKHVIDVRFTNLTDWPIEGEFTFDIVNSEPYLKCAAKDYCGDAPSESYQISIVQD